MEQEITGTDYWYESARRIGTRSLTEEERKRLMAERIGFRIIAVLAGILLPFLFLFFLGAMAVLFDPTGKPSGGIIAWMVGGLVLIALLIIGINYFGRKSTGLKNDLEAGFVNRYPVSGQEWEILPVSNRIWTVDGVVRQWFHAPVEQEELAASPLLPAISEANSVPFDGQSPVPAALATERALTTAELDELRRLAQKRWLPVLPWAFFSNVWFGSMLALGISNGKLATVDPRFFGLGGLAITLLISLGLAIYQAYQFRQDARDGRVFPIILDGKSEERLAVSQVAWTVEGQPAEWRRKPKPPEQVMIAEARQALTEATTQRVREQLPPFRTSAIEQTDKDNAKER